jgi:HPt (histidine-containing phosphotransfer) domain-containing protein
MQVDFIDAYFESTEEELVKLEAALESNDTQTVYIKSHSIKGAARYVGAIKVRNENYHPLTSQVAEHALKLEMLGRDGKLDAVRAGMPALKQELKDTEAELRQYRDSIAQQDKKHD